MIYAFLQAAAQQASVWEIYKGVMLTITPLGILAVVRLQFSQRDDIRDLKKEVGLNGSAHGLRASSIDHDMRLKSLEAWQLTEAAITKTEERLMAEVNRRPERFRDQARSRLAVLAEDEELMNEIMHSGDAVRDRVREGLGPVKQSRKRDKD